VVRSFKVLQQFALSFFSKKLPSYTLAGFDLATNNLESAWWQAENHAARALFCQSFLMQ
jgi:hypothetical protein